MFLQQGMDMHIMGKTKSKKAAVCLDNFQPEKRISMLNLKRS